MVEGTRHRVRQQKRTTITPFLLLQRDRRVQTYFRSRCISMVSSCTFLRPSLALGIRWDTRHKATILQRMWHLDDGAIKDLISF
eukprot:COSAG02_NODE_6000_length_3883_cov_1.367336_4_plen_84_part_00